MSHAQMVYIQQRRRPRQCLTQSACILRSSFDPVGELHRAESSSPEHNLGRLLGPLRVLLDGTTKSTDHHGTPTKEALLYVARTGKFP